MHKPNLVIRCILFTSVVLSKHAYCGEMGRVEANQWFAQIQGGIVSPSANDIMTVDNGSNFPPPLNVDRYSLNYHQQDTFALTIGQRVATHFPLLQSYTISGRIQHINAENVGGTIMQYSLPEFLNYNYHWNIETTTVTADTKLNIVQLASFSPYVNGGLGIAFNKANSYTETAFPGVTPRISPSYSNRTFDEFTYHIGGGLDFALTPHWLLSAGYEFTSLGDVKSGRGQSTWAGESLHISAYHANVLLLGVSYMV